MAFELELLREAMTDPAFKSFLKEAVDSVEDELAAEDRNWINLAGSSSTTLVDSARIESVKNSRLSFYTDPMARQAIRLWTDYTFGEGMSWSADDESTTKALDEFWNDPANACILGARGQRKCSDKLLVDGEIFFVLFLGPDRVTIRTIDPLEISEIITQPEDIETPMFYRRDWHTRQGEARTTYYRSWQNPKNTATPDQSGQPIVKTDEGIIYHMTLNTLSQRGSPLLLPAAFWLKYQRKFLAARISIMLALTRFAWKLKLQGGATAVAQVKNVYDGQAPAAASMQIENQAAEMQPVTVNTGATQAYDDGRMIKLQISSAVGWPEQYFGDLSTGNLATAKTVELPVQKMCSSYQKSWADAYKDMCEIVLANAGVPDSKWYIDFDFPNISPLDAVAIAQTMASFANVFPSFKYSKDVQTAALIALGINDPDAVIAEIEKIEKQKQAEAEKIAKTQVATQRNQNDPNAQQGQAGAPGTADGAPGPGNSKAGPSAESVALLIGALRRFSESLKGNENIDRS